MADDLANVVDGSGTRLHVNEDEGGERRLWVVWYQTFGIEKSYEKGFYRYERTKTQMECDDHPLVGEVRSYSK